VNVRVAIIDSGVDAAHPHVGGVAGGVAVDEDGRRHDDYLDRLGHGTAVTAAIKEKAPQAELYAVKVFDRALSTRITSLVAAIDWAADQRVHLVNVSLGTARVVHEELLRAAVDRAASRGVLIVAARDDDGVRWLPGALPGVIPVQLDATCPRDAYRIVEIAGTKVFRASGFARPFDDLPPERNLNGISFAVANVTGAIARTLHDLPDTSMAPLMAALVRAADMAAAQPTLAVPDIGES
jgi:subtilisin family serine protease